MYLYLYFYLYMQYMYRYMYNAYLLHVYAFVHEYMSVYLSVCLI